MGWFEPNPWEILYLYIAVIKVKLEMWLLLLGLAK